MTKAFFSARFVITAVFIPMILLIAYAISPTVIYLPLKQFSFPSFWIIAPLLAFLCGVAVWRLDKVRYQIVALLAIAAKFSVYLFFNPMLCMSIGNIALVHQECYYQTNLLIDTVLPDEFSEEKFALIKPGMSEKEVLKLLGIPNSSQEKTLRYGSDGASSWWDFAWVEYSITIDGQGKVVSKNRQVYYD